MELGGDPVRRGQGVSAAGTNFQGVQLQGQRYLTEAVHDLHAAALGILPRSDSVNG